MNKIRRKTSDNLSNLLGFDLRYKEAYVVGKTHFPKKREAALVRAKN